LNMARVRRSSAQRCWCPKRENDPSGYLMTPKNKNRGVGQSLGYPVRKIHLITKTLHYRVACFLESGQTYLFLALLTFNPIFSFPDLPFSVFSILDE
jgi:hypothetical protein